MRRRTAWPLLATAALACDGTLVGSHSQVSTEIALDLSGAIQAAGDGRYVPTPETAYLFWEKDGRVRPPTGPVDVREGKARFPQFKLPKGDATFWAEARSASGAVVYGTDRVTINVQGDETLDLALKGVFPEVEVGWCGDDSGAIATLGLAGGPAALRITNAREPGTIPNTHEPEDATLTWYPEAEGAVSTEPAPLKLRRLAPGESECVTLTAQQTAAALNAEVAFRFLFGAPADSLGSELISLRETRVELEKSTNGQDSDGPPGSTIALGDTLVWTYVVRNTGTVTLQDLQVADFRLTGSISRVVPSCPADSLVPGATMVCTAKATALLGLYGNEGAVTATSMLGDTVGAVDASYHTGSDSIPGPKLLGPLTVAVTVNNRPAGSSPGPVFPEGTSLTTRYRVTNSGTEILSNLQVSDSERGVDPVCPASPMQLFPRGSITCTATSTAQPGRLTNRIAVSMTAADGSNVPTSAFRHYVGIPITGLIHIQKSTNGQDADVAPGPQVDVGDPVTWSYTVKNTGTGALFNISVTDSDPGITPSSCSGSLATLLPGDSIQCTAFDTAIVGQYRNVGTATATTSAGVAVAAADPSHYFGKIDPPDAEIRVEKSTNERDADLPAGPEIEVGKTVTWVYVVTNSGEDLLSNIVVTDSDASVTPTCSGSTATLVPGGSITCMATGTAVLGQYQNVGMAIGTSSAGVAITDTDPSHYLGVPKTGEITIEKSTNGQDADTGPGPSIQPETTVRWEYVVTNTGTVPLTSVTVTDSDTTLSLQCASSPSVLQPGATLVCEAFSLAEPGPYSNVGTASGVTPDGTTVTDTDPSHFHGTSADTSSASRSEGREG